MGYAIVKTTKYIEGQDAGNYHCHVIGVYHNRKVAMVAFSIAIESECDAQHTTFNKDEIDDEDPAYIIQSDEADITFFIQQTEVI